MAAGRRCRWTMSLWSELWPAQSSRCGTVTCCTPLNVYQAMLYIMRVGTIGREVHSVHHDVTKTGMYILLYVRPYSLTRMVYPQTLTMAAHLPLSFFPRRASRPRSLAPLPRAGPHLTPLTLRLIPPRSPSPSPSPPCRASPPRSPSSPGTWWRRGTWRCTPRRSIHAVSL